MKTISASLLRFLQTASGYNRADLFSIALPNGQVIRATSGQYDLSLNGAVYYASRYGTWRRGQIISEASFELRANDMELTVYAPKTVTYPNTTVSLMAAAQLGLFDAALVRVYTAYWPLGQPPPVINDQGQLATFSFTQANQNPFTNALWTAHHSASQVLSNALVCTATTQLAAEIYTGITWPLDQYSQAQIAALVAGNGYAATIVRSDIAGNNFYYLDLDASTGFGGIGIPTPCNLQKFVGGVLQTTPFYSFGYVTPNLGDTLALQISGNSLSAYLNGVQVGTPCVDPNPIATGSPGLLVQTAGASSVANIALKNWAGGQLNPISVETKYAGFIKPNGSIARSQIKFEVADALYLLNQKLPRNIIQASCRHTLFDINEFTVYGTRTNCTLNPASFASATMTVASGSTRQSLNTTASLGQAVPYFSLGYVTFLTGQNAGLSFTIKQQTSTTNLLLAASMPLPLAIGDTFTAFAGCDKTEATCNSKFANLIHFGGEPFVPNPEVAI